jgi:PTH1 family peptidyl-tRNA hydrolase
MKYFVGLGNPGEEYVDIRHNVGFMVVNKLKNKKITNKNSVFVKSASYMNESGIFAKEFLAKTKADLNNLYVIHDDLDLPLGTWKIQYAKGPKDNGGINSIEKVLGTKEFWRIRIGINPVDRGSLSGDEIVMGRFTDDEKKIIDGVIDEICKKLATF